MKVKPLLVIIGNSNVGKSTITKKILPKSHNFKGKTGKQPGSTLLIKTIPSMLPYDIVDLPGFGFMKSTSRRREEHIKKSMVKFLEKRSLNIFYALVVINILRIEDELSKYYLKNENTIPLSLEILDFLTELEVRFLIVLNKIDKVSQYDLNKIKNLFIELANSYGYDIIEFKENIDKEELFNFKPKQVPLVQISALKNTNLDTVRKVITFSFEQYKRN